MFVQTGYLVKGHTNREVNEAIKVYGTEQKTNNTRLAKIYLAIHGIEGKIIESNSFYSDPHQLGVFPPQKRGKYACNFLFV
jgi:type I restriction enzyme M protein